MKLKEERTELEAANAIDLPTKSTDKVKLESVVMGTLSKAIIEGKKTLTSKVEH